MRSSVAIAIALFLSVSPASAQTPAEVDLDVPQEGPPPDPALQPTPPSTRPLEPSAAPPDPEVTPSKEGTQWRTDLGVTARFYDVSSNQRSEERLGLSGGATLTRYLNPVVDDSDPRSLQAFLQRASAVDVAFGAGGIQAASPGTLRYSWLDAIGSADLRVTDALVVAPTLRYDYIVDTGATSHRLTGGLDLGVYLGSSRLDLVYWLSDQTTGGRWDRLRWGDLQLAWFAVFDRHYTFRVDAEVFDGGEGGALDAGYYFNRDTAIFVGGTGSIARPDPLGPQVLSAGGTVGASYWISLRARLSLQYGLTFTAEQEAPALQTTQHAVSFDVASRW